MKTYIFTSAAGTHRFSASSIRDAVARFNWVVGDVQPSEFKMVRV